MKLCKIFAALSIRASYISVAHPLPGRYLPSPYSGPCGPPPAIKGIVLARVAGLFFGSSPMCRATEGRRTTSRP